MNPLFAAMLASAIVSGAPAPQSYPSDVAPAPQAYPSDIEPAYTAAPEIPLKPGEFHWLDNAAAPGEVIIVISLSEQLAYVHRGNELVAVSTISSGRPGLETPTGIYPILQKKKVHFSNLYDNAPMPYMQRLTWHGVAMHAGHISGKPSSHGCVRLPKEFARQLYAVTEHGGLVVVSDDSSISSLLRTGLPDYLAVMFGARTPATTLLSAFSDAQAPSYGNADSNPASHHDGNADLSFEGGDSNSFANPR